MKTIIITMVTICFFATVAVAASTLGRDTNGNVIQTFIPKSQTSSTATKFTRDTTLLLAVRTRCTANTNLRIGSTTSAQYPIDSGTSEITPIAKGITFIQYSSAPGTTCYMQDM